MPQDLTTVHPELRQAFKRMPKISFNRASLWLIRLLMNVQRSAKTPKDIHIENRYIPSQDPKTTIRLRTYQAKTLVSPAPVLMWMHGGGFILGKPELDEQSMIAFARELGIVIVSIDYRLAPDFPFPTPLEDCYTALQWVHSHAELLGIDPERIAIGGASAGAGLAATLVQLAYDRDEVHPIFQLLVYPMLDDRTCLRPDIANKTFLIWSQASNRFGWESYLKQQCGLATAPPNSVAARREHLAGLPPAWLGVGTLDIFYEEDVAYSQKLQGSGVACELVTVPGAFHGFELGAEQTQVVRDFRKSQMAALQRYLFPK